MKTQIKFFLAIAVLFAEMKNTNAQSWNLTGNAGTNPAINFVGTTDNNAFKIRANNNVSMQFGTNNFVAVGDFNPNYKLDVNGDINTNSKYRINGLAVLSIHGGGGNTFVGGNSGTAITSGYNNTAVGTYSLMSCATCSGNTAVGGSSLTNNTTGYNNIAYGGGSMANNTTGTYNTASGLSTLFVNTNGNYNTAIGSFALYNSNTDYNTAVGYSALLSVTTAKYNTALGWVAGNSYVHGWFNTFIGSDCDANQNALTNSIALGNVATVTASSQTRLGNSSTLSTGAYTGWTNISDGRYKKNVKEDVKGIDFIMKLRPVTYNLDVTGISNKLNESRGKEINEQMKNAIAEKEKIIYSGFVAQEVEQAAKELGYDFSGVDKPKNENDLYGLRYAEFVVPLVKAVQELSNENNELKSEIRNQRSEIENLKSCIESICNLSEMRQSSDLQSPASNLLFQNSPNPFSETTVIRYNIPSTAKNAELKIFSSDGKEIKSFRISQQGGGQIEINGILFSPGTYNYSLLINGKINDSKQFIIAK